MAVVNPHAAGIDVGGTIQAVVVPKDRDEQSVRTFGAMSCDLEEIVSWLKQRGGYRSHGKYRCLLETPVLFPDWAWF